MVLTVVAASKMVLCGGRYQLWKVAAPAAAAGAADVGACCHASGAAGERIREGVAMDVEEREG